MRALTTLQISRGTNTKQPSYKLENIPRVATSGLKTYVCLPACTFCGKLRNASDGKRTIRLYSAFYLTSVAVSQKAIWHAVRNTFYLRNVPVRAMGWKGIGCCHKLIYNVPLFSPHWKSCSVKWILNIQILLSQDVEVVWYTIKNAIYEGKKVSKKPTPYLHITKNRKANVESLW